MHPMQVWRAGIDPLAEDEELDYDPTAYDCLHRLQLDWPCLRQALGTGFGGNVEVWCWGGEPLSLQLNWPCLRQAGPGG